MASFNVVAAFVSIMCVAATDASGGKMGGGGGGEGSGGSGAAAAAAAGGDAGEGGRAGGKYNGDGMCPPDPGCTHEKLCFPVGPNYIWFLGMKCRFGCRYECSCPPLYCPPPKPGCYNQIEKIMDKCPGLYCTCKVCRRICMGPYY